MADFNTAFAAQAAMRKSIDSVFADTSLTEAARLDVLRKNATDYAEYMRLPVADAHATVAKLLSGAGAPSAIIMKVAPKEQRRRGHLPASPEDEPSTTPDPALFTPRLGTAKMRHATNAEMLKLAQAGIAEEVRKVRADNPGLNEAHARSRIYAENPGLRESLVKMAQGPENEFAKVSSSAESEVATKSEEIKKAHPQLTDAQAYTRAIETTPGLMKRLLDERSGVQADG